MGSLMPPVDIQDESQLKELDKRIAVGPVLVFVYADWCGHCQTFKPKMEELETDPKRTVQVARIRDDVFPKSNLRDVKLEGYPSLMLIKKNTGKPAVFQTPEGAITNTIPDYKNMNQMKTLVRTAGTPQGQKLLEQGKPSNSILTMKPLSPEVTSVEAPVESAVPVSMPPNILADRLPASVVSQLNTSLTASNKALQSVGNNPMQVGGSQHGGSLWSQLLVASKDVAPAAALFLGASMLHKNTRRKNGSKTKRSKGTKRTKRTKRGKTRRSNRF